MSFTILYKILNDIFNSDCKIKICFIDVIKNNLENNTKITLNVNTFRPQYT